MEKILLTNHWTAIIALAGEAKRAILGELREVYDDKAQRESEAN